MGKGKERKEGGSGKEEVRRGREEREGQNNVVIARRNLIPVYIRRVMLSAR